MNTENAESNRRSWLQIAGIIAVTVLLSVAITVWFLNYYLFPRQFEPVQLDARETAVLEQKLDVFSGFGRARRSDEASSEGAKTDADKLPLEPEAYTEVGADRNISLSERELNALLARNTDLAGKVAIDLADRLVSAKLRIPMDPDFPMLGGKTLKARAGVEFAYENERPVVVLKGISVMGVPVPNAWLGGIKNIDLVNEFGQDQGFWRAFADGVEALQVNDGSLKITLKE